MIGGINQAAAAPQPAKADRHGELVKAAQAFEAVFLRQVIGSMRQAKLGDDLLGSSASDQFRDMSDAKLADSMAAEGSGFGIAKMLIAQFERQETGQ